MKKPTIQLLLLITGVIVYDFLFWQHYWGANILIFSTLLSAYLFALEPERFKNKNILITGVGTLLSAILVMTHNSVTSIVALLLSFVVFTGFCLQPQLRSVLAAFPTGIFNFAAAPIAGVIRGTRLSRIPVKTESMLNVVRLSAIPVFICFIFFLIYREANPVFNTLSAGFFDNIGSYIENFFENLNGTRVVFILLGIVIIAGVLINGNVRSFMLWDNRSQDALEVNPTTNTEEPPVPAPIFTIQDEYKMGLILLALMNALILVVNIIDVQWLWHKIEFSANLNLSQLVHEGTNLLILSILLSIAIMVFLFRGVLNYQDNSNMLRYLAYAWIAQNAVMAISVAIRNFHYIYYYGLAYKRIGVLVFLLLTLSGLTILIIKISRKKSFYYMVKNFSWAVYAMLICISLFNWDLIIAKHNTTHQFPQNMDLHFLLSLSDKSLHIIDQNNPILDRDESAYYRSLFEQRVDSFMKRESTEKWQAWNYPEHKTYQYFLEKNSKQHD